MAYLRVCNTVGFRANLSSFLGGTYILLNRLSMDLAISYKREFLFRCSTQ